MLGLLSIVAGVGDLKELSKSCIKIKIYGYDCKLISIEDLIRAKLALKRPKDLEVAKELEIISSKKNILSILFKPIDLNLHKDVCISFREDSFVVSFGDAKKFYEEDGNGAERYIDWLKEKIQLDPLSVVHIWQENEIIGQIELRSHLKNSTCGYVNLYYLIPARRGIGIGKFLDQFMSDYYKIAQVDKVQLSVSPTNLSAITYYKKMGWLDMGPREGHPEVHTMEKLIQK